MSGELNIISRNSNQPDGLCLQEISAKALRIRYLKKEIEKTLIRNHDCGKEQLEFLLQRL